MFFMKNNKKLTAFSLIEIIISLVMISIIMIALIPVMTKKANKPAFISGNGSIRECSTDAVENCEYCIIDKCVICKPGYALVETGGERKCVECNICGTPTPEPTLTPTVSSGGAGREGLIYTDDMGNVTLCIPVSDFCNNHPLGSKYNSTPTDSIGKFTIDSSGKITFTEIIQVTINSKGESVGIKDPSYQTKWLSDADVSDTVDRNNIVSFRDAKRAQDPNIAVGRNTIPNTQEALLKEANARESRPEGVCQTKACMQAEAKRNTNNRGPVNLNY